jgi:hypothetical protein
MLPLTLIGVKNLVSSALVDDAELLQDPLVNLMKRAATAGWRVVGRFGMSLKAIGTALARRENRSEDHLSCRRLSQSAA